MQNIMAILKILGVLITWWLEQDKEKKAKKSEDLNAGIKAVEDGDVSAINGWLNSH